MKIISIIGTRPQYIKVKPIYDFCKKNNIPHIIVDSNQHFSDNVSKNIIKDLGLIIDVNLRCSGITEIDILCDITKKIEGFLLTKDRTNIFVLVYGDTNTSFAASLACYKNNFSFGHIEAGVRNGNLSIPEEVNRIFVDTVSNINFCVTTDHTKNINNPVVSGDLEYELLRNLSITGISVGGGVLTIHRQSNMNEKFVKKLFDFIEDMDNITFPIHHRLKNQKWFSSITKPKNLKIVEPLNYTDMVNLLESVDFVLTDSGGLIKTSPYFGKKTLILRNDVGWKETITKNFSKICQFTQEDKLWIKEKNIERNSYFYSENKNASEIIINTILNIKSNNDSK
jgi:UDP-N-acetylglucosamine 2-epimerase (non-hydrolysing)